MIALRVAVAAGLLAITACGGDQVGVPVEDTAAPSTSASSGTPTSSEAPSGAHPDPWAPAAPNAATAEPAVPVDTSTVTSPDDTDDGGLSVYAPPPGRYLYDATGTIETSGIGGGTEPVPPTSTDDVTVAQEPATMRMVVITRDEGRDSVQEAVIAVTAADARLVRLSHRSGKVGVDYSVNPDPPVVLVRLPYRVGDTWEVAWSDPTSGVSGVGTATVSRRETVATPAGSFETFVVTVTQRLRGTVTGTLTVTSWIDPHTGVQPKQHLVTDLHDATGGSRTDTVRTLRRLPG